MNKQTIESQLMSAGLTRGQHYYFGMWTEENGTQRPAIYFRGEHGRGRQVCVLPEDEDDEKFAVALAKRIKKSIKGTFWDIIEPKKVEPPKKWIDALKIRRIKV